MTEGDLASFLGAAAAVAGFTGVRVVRTRLVLARVGTRNDGTDEHPRHGRVPRRIGLVIAGLGLIAVAPIPGLVIVPLVGVLAWRWPTWAGQRRGRRYRCAVDAEIPQLLDLLAAGSSAGLSAPLALRRSRVALRGPLADELGMTLDAVDLGSRWRDELRSLADRLDLPDLRRAVAAITRTETLGTSLAETTAELAVNVRASRRAAITERARTAPVKMLFPLVFLVLPAFLLLTVVPVLLTTVQSIS
ncbi:MAG: type II secretion system F family protein [Actinomycetota bacterium]